MKFIITTLLCTYLLLPTVAMPTFHSFRSEIQQLVSENNPAALGIQNEDLKIPIRQVVSGRENGAVPGDVDTASTMNLQSIIGVEMPIGRLTGFGCYGYFLYNDFEIETSYTFDYLGDVATEFHPRIYNLGGKIGFGYPISAFTSVGMALHVFNEWNKLYNGTTIVTSSSSPYLKIEAGALFDRWRFILDFYGTYTNQNEYYLDEKDRSVRIDKYPFSVAGGLAWEMLWPVYLTINLSTDIYVADRKGHVFEAVTVIHPWVHDIMRLRAGYIYTHSSVGGKFSTGHGFLAGFTIWEEDVDGFSFELEYNLKPRHLPILPGRFVYEHFISVGIAFGIILL